MSIRHDYKSATIRQRRQRARRYGLLVMTLVLIGLFGGLLAYIKGDQTPLAPATAAVTTSALAQPPAPAPLPAPTQPPTPAGLAGPPTAVVAPPAQPQPVKPKYDFYTELPKRKIAIQRETVNPGNASQPAPARIQPAANSKPRGNAKKPTSTMTAASGAKPDSKTTNSKTANSKTTNSKITHSKTASSTSTNSRSATVKATHSEPANSKSTSTHSKSTATTSRPATTKPTPAATPARTTQPLRPLANNSSKVVVKTE